jgi:hypothetical protein
MSLYMEHAIESIEKTVPVKTGKDLDSYFKSSKKDVTQKLKSSSRVFKEERPSV